METVDAELPGGSMATIGQFCLVMGGFSSQGRMGVMSMNRIEMNCTCTDMGRGVPHMSHFMTWPAGCPESMCQWVIKSRNIPKVPVHTVLYHRPLPVRIAANSPEQVKSRLGPLQLLSKKSMIPTDPSARATGAENENRKQNQTYNIDHKKKGKRIVCEREFDLAQYPPK